MELEITPEPSPEERAALEQALSALASRNGRPDRGEWWREGVREAVSEEPQDGAGSAD